MIKNKEMVNYPSLLAAALALHEKLSAAGIVGGNLYGVPRGGVSAAILFARVNPRWRLVDKFSEADLVVDDLLGSGATLERLSFSLEVPRRKHYAVLFSKDDAKCDELGVVYGYSVPPGRWLVFPWEESLEGSAADIFVRLIEFIGEDPKRGGLIETPARAMRAWQEWTSGYAYSPEEVLKSFEDGADHYDEMVMVKDIPVYSHCEHHLAPFFGVAHIAYIPGTKIVGLSKLSRLVEIFSRRLQVQERLTVQIADALDKALEPRGVGVMVQCRHLCMESRGIERSKLTTVTTALRGFLKEGQARDEFLKTINAKGSV